MKPNLKTGHPVLETQTKLRNVKMKITKRQLKRIIKEEKAKLLSEARMPDENVITMLLSTVALRMINGPESKAGYDLYNALMKELSDNGYSTDIDDLLGTLK